jgi:hypothetical protein
MNATEYNNLFIHEDFTEPNKSAATNPLPGDPLNEMYLRAAWGLPAYLQSATAPRQLLTF